MIDKTLVNLYQCHKCNYQWTSWDDKNKRESPLPRYCPKCKNMRWNQRNTDEQLTLSKDLQSAFIIREIDNPYTKYYTSHLKENWKMNEYDFIAASFFFKMNPPPQMFELRQLASIPPEQLEQRHEFMLSLIKDRINNAKKYEEQYNLSHIKLHHFVAISCAQRRIPENCNHKPIPEIEEALYHVTEDREFYDMWNNPTN